jgi:hypothetical protein
VEGQAGDSIGKRPVMIKAFDTMSRAFVVGKREDFVPFAWRRKWEPGDSDNRMTVKKGSFWYNVDVMKGRLFICLKASAVMKASRDSSAWSSI